jgi:Ca2+-binding RTX toxin-like protein
VSVGGRGLDRMDGGTGDDVLIDPWSRSIVDGGEGTDRCVVSRTSAAESCETLNRVTAARARPR